MGEGVEREATISRRYYCEFCGICRSKKTLIASHSLSHHQEKMKEQDLEKKKEPKTNICVDCGSSFKKPAHLKQHMLSHSLEDGRPPEKLRQESLRHAPLLRLKCENVCVKHWIPNKELQNAKRLCSLYLDWTSIRMGDLLRSSIERASDTHSFERPFICPVDDCHSSYRRKDHLNRHLLRHQGKLFKCHVENCNREFTIHGNLKRHLTEIHAGKAAVSNVKGQRKYVCQESGCGKEFKFLSKLRKHENSHVKLESTEAFCADPSCMKPFTNVECLKAHTRSCHRHVICQVCGSKHLRKNIKRHLRSHEDNSPPRIKCSFDGCDHVFTTNSNLQQHVKAVHLNVKPFACRVPGCGKRFAFKHVRENHEKSSCHVYVPGDLEEIDEQFRSRPLGGRKRKRPAIETLLRKRVVPPSECDDVLSESADYLTWLMSGNAEVH